MIEAFAADAPDHALDISVLPGRSRRGPQGANAHGMNSLVEDTPVRAVAVAQQEAWSIFGTDEGRENLRGEPDRCRIRGYSNVQNAPPFVVENDEDEQPSESQRRYDEQIAGDDLTRVVAQECVPSLTAAGAHSRHHVLGDSRLGDRESEKAKLSLNTRRAPEWVLLRRPANQRDDTTGDGRAAVFARLHSPEKPPTAAMPAHDGAWLDEYERVSPTWPDAQQENPEESISAPESWARHVALERDQLLPKRDVLRDEGRARSEE